MSNIKIAVINESSKIKDADVKPVVDALQIQVSRDYAPLWGTDATIVFVPKGSKPDPTQWWLVLLDNSDQAGALGYHDLTNTGLPLGKVFVATDIQYGLKWSVTASHELLEMLGDPDINQTVFIQDTMTTGTLYAFENCDAVEDDSFGYDIDGIMVSDFVLPSYFQPSIPGDKWDFCGHLTGPVPNMLPGGYLSQFVVGHGSHGWTQINAMVAPTQASSRAGRALPGARRSKRVNKVKLQVSNA